MRVGPVTGGGRIEPQAIWGRRRELNTQGIIGIVVVVIVVIVLLLLLGVI